MKKLVVPMLMLVGLGLGGALLVSCKQDVGERCQLDDDCKSGVCSQATHTCTDPTDNQNDIDATVPPIIDAPPDAFEPPTEAAPGDGPLG